MKEGFLLSILLLVAAIYWSLPFYAQREVKIEKQYGEMDYAPRIKNVFDGEISFDKLCSNEGITTRIGAKVITFDALLCTNYEKPIHIIGNEIPDSVCLSLFENCIFTDIFIINIKAMDLDGSIKNLNPLRFFIVPE
jgi:hypothetical protein